ncbi:MAG: hypothetical protein ACM3TN_15585 [Alphaproteobacteria bacterium]
MRKPVVGVMGASANDALTESEQFNVENLAESLGATLANRGCILITGATTGIPGMVARAFRDHGGFALGISPAENHREHVERYGLPDDGADVIVYSGFGYKGRNVINVRSADIVIIFGGATGTLNEFTIAYDEGKIVGVLEGSGGIADYIRAVIEFCKKACPGVVLFDQEPERLIARCLEALGKRERAL